VSRHERFKASLWALKRLVGDGSAQHGQWYIRQDSWDDSKVDICPSNGDGTMNVYSMNRRDARLLAKRINQMLDETK
jgi:hypothetical protein